MYYKIKKRFKLKDIKRQFKKTPIFKSSFESFCFYSREYEVVMTPFSKNLFNVWVEVIKSSNT